MTNTIDSQAFKDFERNGYSDVADGYTQIAANFTSQANSAILAAANVSAGSQMLDIACGPGNLSAAGAALGATTVGIDFAPNMLANARSRNPELQFQEGDAENLPFDAETFDAVVCSCGLLHFPDPEKAIAEAFRVLKPGGRYCFTCWTPPASSPLFTLLLGPIQKFGNMDLDIPAAPPLFRFGDPAECERVLSEAGFGAISTSIQPIDWYFASVERLLPDLKSMSGRIVPMFDLQTPEARLKIEEAILEGAKAYLTPDGLRIPSNVVVASGSKPNAV
jgi:SAM-dependent methyltransferase